MKPISFNFPTTLTILLCTALVTPFQAHAIVAATIHPADSFDAIHIETNPRYINYNPGLNPVIHREGYSQTNGIEVDASTGTIKGYSGYSLGAAGTVTRTSNLIDRIAGSSEKALVANTAGHIFYNYGTLIGSTVGTNTFAKISINVDGSFNYQNGSPSLGLLGIASINVIRGGMTTGYNVGANITNFDTQNLIPDATSVFTRQDLQVFDGLGNVTLNPNLTGITWGANFLDLNPNALSMQINLQIPIQVGDQLQFGGSAAGSASHAFLEDFRNITVGATGNVDAATGYVDFLNTATLSIELPQGLRLSGSDVPESIIRFTPVPLPAAVWLFLTGIVGVLGRKWQLSN